MNWQKSKIKIKQLDGYGGKIADREVDAIVCGPFAVHRSAHTPRLWMLTLVRLGVWVALSKTRKDVQELGESLLRFSSTWARVRVTTNPNRFFKRHPEIAEIIRAWEKGQS
jgi:hypothetical protein